MSKLAAELSAVTSVGLDLAKHVFQVHCLDPSGMVIAAKALRRRDVLPFFASLDPCLIGMEACGSAHFWGHELMALGHDVKLIPPAYVKPFVKRQKNEKNDAAAIYETLSRSGLRFVKVRSVDNQAVLMQHKACAMLAQQRTQLFNGLRGHRSVTASALAATVGDPSVFSGPREFAAFPGLVPRQNSSGGKTRLGLITKMGNQYLRKLLVVGAHAVLVHQAKHSDLLRNWARKLLETKPFKLVAVATANKLARMAFALMSQDTRYCAA